MLRGVRERQRNYSGGGTEANKLANKDLTRASRTVE
jgi:hypothetical protein